jgi:tripartite-type tricarboxylate transporter receptor subunit TctC
MNRTTLALAALGVTLLCAGAQAQSWPNRPVRFIVAAAPGAAPDIIARLIGERLTAAIGQQVIVDNRPGASGNIGTSAGARAPADGHNFLFAQAFPIVGNQFLFKSLPYDPERDFVPIVGLGVSPMMVAVNPDVKAATLGELIALARAQPGKIALATSGSKNIPHLTGELIAATAGVELYHVPYKTSPQASADTIGGQTQIYIDGIPPMTAHLKSGRLRILAVSAPQRLANFPHIPAVAETLPGFSMVGWFALLGPAGTSPEVVKRLNAEINQIVKTPDIAERMTGFGMYEPGGTPEALATFIANERAAWQKAIKAARIEAE